MKNKHEDPSRFLGQVLSHEARAHVLQYGGPLPDQEYDSSAWQTIRQALRDEKRARRHRLSEAIKAALAKRKEAEKKENDKRYQLIKRLKQRLKRKKKR